VGGNDGEQESDEFESLGTQRPSRRRKAKGDGSSAREAERHRGLAADLREGAPDRSPVHTDTGLESRHQKNIGSVPEDEGKPAIDGRDIEAEALVSELLDYFLGTMGVVADTFVRDELVNGALAFDIEGEDAGLLIGRRGETLQALQFIVSMIVSRQLGRKCYINIDVEGYRARRIDRLRSLARRIASNVDESGQSIPLEPMSSYERRIVHIALADHPRVITESDGEGAGRRVVIHPKS
jgi:spoIIIJ-associated protein